MSPAPKKRGKGPKDPRGPKSARKPASRPSRAPSSNPRAKVERRDPRPQRREAAPEPRAEPGARERTPDANVVYGRNPVRELLAAGRRPARRIWATPGAAREDWLTGRDVRTATAEEIEERCGSADHQGVCAEAGPYPYVPFAELLAEPDPLIVALDEVQDPQNLGAICRTAEAAGATGLIVPERRSAHVTASVCKASAGAVEHLRIAEVRNLADALTEAREAGCWAYGAAAGAPTRYDTVDWRGGVVLVLGAEGRGLRPRVAGNCDDLVSLPLRGRVASLNVSATAAVLLYAAVHGRDQQVDTRVEAP
jgi:23S rRNA (guanosine2251-2'-O)-methyltransferase